MSYRSIDIAKHILALANSDEQELISNLKLQKLLYFTQGFSLAINNRKLFDDAVLAWQHGPVLRSIYNAFSEYGSQAIFLADDVAPPLPLSKKDEDVVVAVYNTYGRLSAWALRDLTHKSGPWSHCFENGYATEITDVMMQNYFNEFVTGSEAVPCTGSSGANALLELIQKKRESSLDDDVMKAFEESIEQFDGLYRKLALA